MGAARHLGAPSGRRALTFRALRDASGGISSSVLARRLAELMECRIVGHSGEGYVLTPTGQRLVTSFEPLLGWSRAWAAELARDPVMTQRG
jgi:DNA-binding HxlR family transcriptional regulator